MRCFNVVHFPVHTVTLQNLTNYVKNTTRISGKTDKYHMSFKSFRVVKSFSVALGMSTTLVHTEISLQLLIVCTDVYVPQRINLTDFGDTLMFPGQGFH